MASPVRLGVVGAGTFSQNRMLPNFASVAGVDVLAEANRSRKSGELVADQPLEEIAASLVESVRTRLY